VERASNVTVCTRIINGGADRGLAALHSVGLGPATEAGMGASSEAFVEYVMDQLGTLGGLVRERFFGGVALKSQGLMFAMIMDGSLYFAVDERLRKRYQDLGSRCFSYDTKKGRVEVTRFYEVPADLVEDADGLVGAARESLAVAAKRPASRKRSK
jgi:DNA transformation protein